MKQTSANDIYSLVKTLSTKIHQASWVDKDKPHAQYSWVVGYMESLMKNLPRTTENMQYLSGELNHLENYLSKRG